MEKENSRMREEFLAIISGWILIDSVESIGDKLEEVSKWLETNGPPNEAEERTLKLMVRTQVAKGIRRGDFEDCGIFPGDEEELLK